MSAAEEALSVLTADAVRDNEGTIIIPTAAQRVRMAVSILKREGEADVHRDTDRRGA